MSSVIYSVESIVSVDLFNLKPIKQEPSITFMSQLQ